MVNVGLVIGPVTPSARQAPRTNVVLPVPISPRSSTTSPGRSSAARAAAAASVSEALEVLIGRAQAQAESREQQREAGEDELARVAAGVGQGAASRGARGPGGRGG